MRVLVCGGRDFDDRELVFRTLDRIHERYGIECIIHGGARGADSLARLWAVDRCIPMLTFTADWEAYGVVAGPIRNKRMLVEGKPNLVVAFPGGRGTKDMVTRARKVIGVVVIAANGHRVECLAPDLERARLAQKVSRIVLGDKREP